MRKFQYGSFKRFVVSSLLAWILSSCKTSQGNSPEGIGAHIDGEVNQVINSSLASEPDEVPAFLWSPARRQATAGYLYLASEFMSLGGESAKASSVLEAAYNLDPNAFLGAKMIMARAEKGENEQALLEAQRMVLLYPKSAPLRFILGQMFTRSQKLDEAYAEFEKTIELDRGHEPAYIALIVIDQIQKRNLQALKVAERYTQAFPNSAAAWALLARQRIVNNKRAECLEPARRAYELQSSNPEMVLVYALALELNEKSEQAISLYEQLYRLAPTNEELASRMVEIYRQMGGLDSALEILNELAERTDGDKPGIQMQRAIILWEKKRFEEAAKILDELHEKYPESERITYLTGMGKEKVQQPNEAIRIYEGIPENSVFRVHGDLRILLIHADAKAFDKADKVFERLSKREDVIDTVYIAYAAMNADQNKADRSIELMKEAQKKFPTNQKLLFFQGVYEEKAGDRKASKQSMKDFLKTNVNDSGALNFLGYMLAEDGEDLDEAEKLLNRALEIKKNDAFYLDSLAWVYFQKKQFQKALQILEGLIKNSKEIQQEGVVFEHAARCYQALGKNEEAKVHFKRALESQLDPRDRIRIERLYNDFVKKVGT